MTGSNDVSGTRHEATLIAIEHLVGSQRRTAAWELRVTSFDLRSPLDLERTRLDRSGLTTARERLLTRPLGGSSTLGPALRASECQQQTPPRLLIVHSDFELFDDDVESVLRELIDSSAVHVLALVYRSQPPPALMSSRVETHQIDSATQPADVARLIVEAANTTVELTTAKPQTGGGRGGRSSERTGRHNHRDRVIELEP